MQRCPWLFCHFEIPVACPQGATSSQQWGRHVKFATFPRSSGAASDSPFVTLPFLSAPCPRPVLPDEAAAGSGQTWHLLLFPWGIPWCGDPQELMSELLWLFTAWSWDTPSTAHSSIAACLFPDCPPAQLPPALSLQSEALQQLPWVFPPGHASQLHHPFVLCYPLCGFQKGKPLKKGHL